MRKLSRSSTAASSSSTNGAPPPPSPSAAIPASLLDPQLPLPRLFVFDLDYTLWPFWVDTHPTPPLKTTSSRTAATDRYGEEFAFYPDVPQILQFLTRAAAPSGPIKLGVASRTSATALARELLKILHVPVGEGAGEKAKRAGDVFDAGMEIYPGSKIRHFEALQKRTGVAYEDMLFFDDESRNMETERLGITMRLIRDGLTWAEVEKGVEEWRKRRGYKKN
ncbi:magnesium dependent phosphatase [Cordyceps fumosorosea ARSEF 2679]|uniref:Magnesium dependent phosphatase n=1 Tax=Cordyceps fumosorosea (strain ARSEF 2679) TaxID=1081104 RepID=A0A167Y9U6_CORFA|nr:magnesium dependent phosphatase [Cordyceps fumosorosea ARSEF 2679]OAA66036.1 magnesium dependent phosphatase [Cordyceps fumosorosea ARSEF 2679]